MKTIITSLLICFCLTASGQVQAPQPSPLGKIEQKVGLTNVSVEYSRPGMRGRTIFGDLVPYGKIWRTGANANTTISFSDDVTIEGNSLKEGKYAIYTIPNEENWQVIFYKSTDNWGVPQEWDESKVALKATAEVEQLPFEIESFTIFINNLTDDSCVLEFVWADKVATLPIQFPTDEKTMASIDNIMNGPTANDYFSAAAYYHDSGKDLNKAYTWITKAADMAGEDAYWVFRKKSLIEADLGKKQEAIASAKRSLASAKKNGNPDYVKLNEDSLKEWGGM